MLPEILRIAAHLHVHCPLQLAVNVFVSGNAGKQKMKFHIVFPVRRYRIIRIVLNIGLNLAFQLFEPFDILRSHIANRFAQTIRFQNKAKLHHFVHLFPPNMDDLVTVSRNILQHFVCAQLDERISDWRLADIKPLDEFFFRNDVVRGISAVDNILNDRLNDSGFDCRRFIHCLTSSVSPQAERLSSLNSK